MKRVMTYTRIKGDSTLLWEPSLLAQFNGCQEYASKQGDWQITQEVYVISDKTHLDETPLGVLYERIHNQEMDVLLVSSLDRISLDQEVVMHLYRHCKRSEVILESVTEDIDAVLGGKVEQEQS